MRDVLVTLGAGHGGFDCGTVGPDGLAEKDVTLYLSNCIRRRLSRISGFETIPVRLGDEYVPTVQRAGLILRSGSHCHVELHVDLDPDRLKSAAVWFSSYLPSDRSDAAALSSRLSRACGVPDCGARVRFDYGTLFRKLDGFEDYYTLIETLGSAGIGHAFYCECGLDPAVLKRHGLSRIAARITEAVVRTLCGIYRAFPTPELPGREPPPLTRKLREAVFLKPGYYNIRAGPGARYPVVGMAQGLMHAGVYGISGDWLKISPDFPEYLCVSAVELYLGERSREDGQSLPARGFETVGRESFYFVMTLPSTRADVLGAVGSSACFATERLGGWRRILYGDRPGFVVPSAFG